MTDILNDIRSIPPSWVHPTMVKNGEEKWAKLKPYDQYHRDFRKWCDKLERFFIDNKRAAYQGFLDQYGEKPNRRNYMPFFRHKFTLIDVHYFNDAPAMPVDIWNMLSNSLETDRKYKIC